jgi:hypothetical protein
MDEKNDSEKNIDQTMINNSFEINENDSNSSPSPSILPLHINSELPQTTTANIFQTIESMIQQINSQSFFNFVNTNNEIIQFSIQVELINPVNMENNDEDEDENIKFNSCKEINEKLGKAQKINDTLLNETLQNQSCFICIECYKKSELLRILPNCKHSFHKKCIDKWLKKNATCPTCRDPLIV